MIFPEKFKKVVWFLLIVCLFLVYLSPTKSYASIWQKRSDLPYPIASFGYFDNQNKIFVLGGANDFAYPYVYSSEIDNNQNLSQWSTQPWIYNLYWHSLVFSKNKVYILGGHNNPYGSVNNVRLSNLDQNNNLGSWIELNPLPMPLELGGAIALNNHLYYIGGEGDSGVNDDVYVADINSNGTIGAWRSAGKIPGGMLIEEMVFGYHNKIVTVGGVANLGNKIDAVHIATTDENGNISNWTDGQPLPIKAMRSYAIQSDNKLLILGGIVNSYPESQTDAIFYTSFDSSDNLKPWTIASRSAFLPNPACCGGSVLINNYIYLLGGYSGFVQGGYLSSVLRANIDDIIPIDYGKNDLNVPLLKQTNVLWGNNEYDNANLWSPNNKTISSWGCALTSAAMVLNYHGIDKLPDGKTLDPGTLNDWLKTQNDGYVDAKNSGYLNWLAIARLSKLAKNINNISAFDTLEYLRTNGIDNQKLTNDLNHKIPDILETSGHFVVAKGIGENTFNINDPYYDVTTLDKTYSNSYNAIGTFSPASSDLSYVMITSADPSLEINLKDQNNNNVGEVFIENPIANDQNPNNKMNPIKIIYFPKPDNSNYNLEVLSNQDKNYNLKFYLYDQSGNYKINEENGNVSALSSDNIQISFNKNDVNSSLVKKIVTYEKIIRDIENGVNLKQINYRISKSLITLIKQAEKESRLKIKSAKLKVKITLNAFILEVNIFEKIKLISRQEAQILRKDVNNLTI